MAITKKPQPKVDLERLDALQGEMFDQKDRVGESNAKEPSAEKKKLQDKPVKSDSQKLKKSTPQLKKSTPPRRSKSRKTKPESGSQTEGASIADLLSTKKSNRVRYKSCPYTIPRSMIADLDKLKLELRSREIQLTQNELIDKLLQESLEYVTSTNFKELSEKGLSVITSPEKCSRRTVTISEKTALRMSELKAEIHRKTDRKVTNEDLFITLFSIALMQLH